jgi:hypothetical protein
LKTPYNAPKANAICERWIGSARREYLDFMIPINDAHIRQTLKFWVAHYNGVRPDSSLDQEYRIRVRRRQRFKPTALHSERLPSCCNFHSRWSASRNRGWKELLHIKRSKRSESVFCGAQGHALGILREAANISRYRLRVSCIRLIHVVHVGYLLQINSLTLVKS